VQSAADTNALLSMAGLAASMALAMAAAVSVLTMEVGCSCARVTEAGENMIFLFLLPSSSVVTG